MRQWLVHAMADSPLPAVERVLAGRHLAQLGDPRPEVVRVDAMQFCLVPGGDFWLGEGEEMEPVSFLKQDYWLARFPVTVAQFRTFVDEGGYADREWWAEAIAADLWEEGAYTAYGDRCTAPRDFGPEFALDNQPVVGVSWFEALAFTRWLTARWREAGLLPEAWRAALPSEAEWEKGARGGLSIPRQGLVCSIKALDLGSEPAAGFMDNPDPRRPYTWLGGEISAELANYKESDINRTSAVGCYPGATSVYGNEEMLGNVFEWTRSLYRDYPYDPDDGREILARKADDWTVLRGGAWSVGEEWSRCGARYRRNSAAHHFSGIRVALSPSDSGR